MTLLTMICDLCTTDAPLSNNSTVRQGYFSLVHDTFYERDLRTTTGNVCSGGHFMMPIKEKAPYLFFFYTVDQPISEKKIQNVAHRFVVRRRPRLFVVPTIEATYSTREYQGSHDRMDRHESLDRRF